MGVQPLATTDGFVVRDLDDDIPAVGVVRVAPKILRDGASWLARSRTYQAACFERRLGGASVGVNARPPEASDAIASACAELGDLVRVGTLLVEPGKGVTDEQLAPLLALDPRGEAWWDRRHGVLAAGVLAAVPATGRPLDGATVALEGIDALGDRLLAELATGVATAGGLTVVVTTAAGAVHAPGGFEPASLVEAARSGTLDALGSSEATEQALARPVDVLLTGSRAGVIGHALAPSLGASLVVPWGPIPVTAKALAELRRREVLVLADFVTTAGPMLVTTAGLEGATPPADAASAATAIAQVVGEVVGAEEGPVLGACHRAESFLATWRDALPFGRPLA